MRQAIAASATEHGLRASVMALVSAAALALPLLASAAFGQFAAPPPPATSQWQTSPFHGVTGGDGKVIPCRCLYRGRSFQLGEKVCMTTHVGTVITECDLQQNNTSWVPTSETCAIS